ncbi:MAG: hypothetical protein WAN28_00835, partial [Terracidiphilus sp.]
VVSGFGAVAPSIEDGQDERVFGHEEEPRNEKENDLLKDKLPGPTARVSPLTADGDLPTNTEDVLIF